jgi:hypothetical protein
MPFIPDRDPRTCTAVSVTGRSGFTGRKGGILLQFQPPLYPPFIYISANYPSTVFTKLKYVP